MEAVSRKRFQGIGNIIRFNWHFYVLATAGVWLLLFVKRMAAPALHPVMGIAGLLVTVSLLVSLGVSFYVYDLSGLYNLDWLKLAVKPGAEIVNIHAGFDETSRPLLKKYPQASLRVFDFYDRQKHTEVSIKRARKAYPAYPGTKAVSTAALPLPAQSVDAIFCFLSAHEIRDGNERSFFFQQLRNALKDEGRLVVVEHLRDAANFLAYSVGAFHFHSAAAWKQTFSSAGLFIEREQKLTPFLTVYYLQKNGSPS